jgi:hypothetical protein
MTNIEIATLSIKPDAFADKSLAEQLEPIAQKIELLETAAIPQIASEAAKIHEHFRYWRAEGGYTGYMKRRLGYSSSSAYSMFTRGLARMFPKFGRDCRSPQSICSPLRQLPKKRSTKSLSV